MQIHEICIHDLKAYENNPRKIPEESINAVAASIKEFGFKVPVIIDKDNVIVAGHTRILAAEKLGIEKVPCIIADDLTPEQIKAFRLADNKVSELSGWDFEKLEIELEESNLSFNMADFGFDSPDFNFIDEFNEIETNSSKEHFSMTFTIDKMYQDKFDDYIKKYGKQNLQKFLIDMVVNNA